MKNLNACEDLILKYSDALILAAYEDLVTKQNPQLLQCHDEGINSATANNLVDLVVDGYVFLKTNLTDTTYKFKCRNCSKEYATKENLLKHRQLCSQSVNSNTTEDSIKAYSKNALMLTFLIKDFIDARKYGDGERILKLYKYFL